MSSVSELRRGSHEGQFELGDPVEKFIKELDPGRSSHYGSYEPGRSITWIGDKFIREGNQRVILNLSRHTLDFLLAGKATGFLQITKYSRDDHNREVIRILIDSGEIIHRDSSLQSNFFPLVDSCDAGRIDVSSQSR